MKAGAEPNRRRFNPTISGSERILSPSLNATNQRRIRHLQSEIVVGLPLIEISYLFHLIELTLNCIFHNNARQGSYNKIGREKFTQ
jgi:hypothetical protein